MCFLGKVSQEHAGKTNRLKVTYITYRLHCRTITFQWNLKLIPSHLFLLAILQCHLCLHNAGYMLLPNTLQIFFPQRYMIAVKTLVIIQSIIIINILNIRLQCRCFSVWLIVHHLRRVAFCAIKMFISHQHWNFILIVIISSIVVIIITCWII